MATKTLDLETSEALIARTAALACTKCGESSWTKASPANQTKKAGMLTVRCMVCERSKSLAYKNGRLVNDLEFRAAERARNSAYYKDRHANDPEWREARNEKSLAYHKDRHANDPEWREARNERSSICHNKRYVNDLEWREAHNARTTNYQKENPGKMAAYAAKYRAAKLQATPPWSETAAIAEFYVNCPPGHHVDHIVPLQGELVSGLHVASNLQYLTASENLSKSNKHTI